jgi:hypothetical protein
MKKNIEILKYHKEELSKNKGGKRNTRVTNIERKSRREIEMGERLKRIKEMKTEE